MHERTRGPGGWRYADMMSACLVSACNLIGLGRAGTWSITAQAR